MKKYMITIVVLVIVIFVLYSTRDTDYTVVYGKDTISLIGKRFGHSDSMWWWPARREAKPRPLLTAKQIHTREINR